MDARFRFKAPMAAGVTASVGASIGEADEGRIPVVVDVSSDAGTHVAASIGVRADSGSESSQEFGR